MSFALFVLGAVFSAVGIMVIGFGIPINEFSLGNTLIIAGTTALAAGAVVIGLAVTNRQLKRLIDQLAQQQRAPEVQPFPVPARNEAPRPPAAPKSRAEPPRPDMREGAFAERPFAAPASEEGEFNQPRMRAGSPPIFEQIEDVTLSPRTPPRMPGIEPHAAEPAVEQRAWRPPGSRQPAPGGESGRKEAMSPPERSVAPATRGNQEGMFESIWPTGRRQERPTEPAASPPSVRPSEDVFHRTPAATSTSDTGVVSVLKSGVVDGMAYTLYTDGSIEAELAQGVVRFGSIEELRNHLEKSA